MVYRRDGLFRRDLQFGADVGVQRRVVRQNKAEWFRFRGCDGVEPPDPTSGNVRGGHAGRQHANSEAGAHQMQRGRERCAAVQQWSCIEVGGGEDRIQISRKSVV